MKPVADMISNLENLETLITTVSKRIGKHYCIQKQYSENKPISIYQKQTTGK